MSHNGKAMHEALPYIVAGIMLSFGAVGLWWKHEWREYAKLLRHFRALMAQRDAGSE